MPYNRFNNLLRPTPFKIGILVVILCNLLFYSFGGVKPALLESLDNQLIDAMFRWRGSQQTSGSVAIVDIDENSMKAVGQWPWSRNIVAALTAQIASAGAKSIGFDIVFAEADRTSPMTTLPIISELLPDVITPETLAKFAEAPEFNYDLLLGETVSTTPSVLGYVFQTINDGLKNESDKPFPSINVTLQPDNLQYQDLTLIPAYRSILNTADISMAPTEGFFNVFPDPAGTVRKVPLFMELDGLPYPSLALEMIRIGQNISKVTIHASQQVTGEHHTLLGISLDERFIPTDSKGQVTVNYRGPMKTFPYLSAVDVLNGKNTLGLNGKHVLIGTSAAGLLDLRATPFSNVFAGVEVHANLIDNILAGDPLTQDIFTEIGITYTTVTIGGILLTALLAFSSPLIGGLGGMFLITIYIIYGNYHFFFRQNQLVGITFPLLSVFAVFLFVTLFNYFFKDREKRFVQGAFGHYVSPEVVAELIESPEKLSLAGHEKVITIFFNDIRGFTSISERMDSKHLGVFMNKYLTAMSTVIMDHKGTVDKFIGDAIMALWGAPLDDEQHAANAVRASLEMMQTLHELQIVWSEQGLPPIDIGIGLNTGMVSVGNFGSDQRFDYTVIGDNVNLASRLEGLNKVYGTNILITGSTFESLKGQFTCRFVDLVRVKGKNKPVEIYEPITEGEGSLSLQNEIKQFEQALDLYRQRAFKQSLRLIQQLQMSNPTPLYKLYISRINYFQQNPPSSEWDGVYTATSK